MGDISNSIPKESKTVSAIYFHHEKKNELDKITSSIPISQLGGPCDRKLWYTFRHCSQEFFEGRMLRLFETGDLEEPRFTEELRGIGCEVHVENLTTGKQFLVTAVGGHVRGYLDGCALGIPEAPKSWHVLEFKSHNQKSFNPLKKHGVQKHKPEHFAQMQIGMHLTGMTRALYLAVNKNTDELYSERVKYGKPYAEELIERARRIITSNTPPERISDKPDFYQCRWCSNKDLCFGSVDPDAPALPLSVISCRQCCHSTPIMDEANEGYGRWQCERHNRVRALSLNDQLGACGNHLLLPPLLPFVEPSDYGVDDSGKDFIHFNDEDYGEWFHGNGPGTFTSRELTITPHNILCNKLINEAKKTFQAEVQNATKDILEEYKDATVVWKGRASELVLNWGVLYGENLVHIKSIGQSDLPTHTVKEYSGGRIAILYSEEGNAEIRFAPEQIPF